MIDRRQFLGSLAAMLAAMDTKAQSTTAPLWGGPALDIHSHLRQGLDANMVHMEGCGVTNAVLLARATAVEQVKAIQAKYPKRFIWAASTDITKPDAVEVLTKAVKDGAQGLGETQVSRRSRWPGVAADVCARGGIGRADSGAFPGSAAFRGRRRLEHRLQAVRGDAESVSENQIYRTRRCFLGERQRRLCQ